jgi:hypothetical protein
MKRITLLLILCMGSSLLATAQTVDEVIAKAIAARGGMDKLKAVQTQRLSGHITIGDHPPGPFMVEMQRGGKMRQEMTVDGQSAIRTTDGTTGWKLSAEGGGSPEPLSAGELKNMAGGADIDGPLVDYKAKGNQVELEGTEKVDGNDAYKLKITQKDGMVRYDYLDAKSYLEVKWQGEIDAGTQKFVAESFFTDYRPVNGVMYHYQIDSDTIGTPYKQKLVFDKIDVNLPLDDAVFGRPAIPSPAPAGNPPK